MKKNLETLKTIIKEFNPTIFKSIVMFSTLDTAKKDKYPQMQTGGRYTTSLNTVKENTKNSEKASKKAAHLINDNQ